MQPGLASPGPVWEWIFLWLHFNGCPEVCRPGSGCVNQYLLLLIIKTKATLCLEHTSQSFCRLSGPDLTPGQVWGGGGESTLPSFQELLAWGDGGGGQLLAALLGSCREVWHWAGG